jgi:hypothetical protein
MPVRFSSFYSKYSKKQELNTSRYWKGKLTAVGAVLPDISLGQVPDRHGWNKNNQLIAFHQH